MIETRYLSKVYNDLVALDKLSLTIDRGDIYGFIGPNGAGKTTTIKILATLLRPTSGQAFVCGYSVNGEAKQIRRKIGYVPDEFGIYEDMTVLEYLEFFAALYELGLAERKRVIRDVLELTDLSYKENAQVDSLSRGMRQRLALARVLLHDPEVLLLDEPASGLDPRARIEIRELLKELRNMGKTILISSHILSELRELCNKVGIIEKGKLLFSGPIEEILEQVRAHDVIQVQVREAPEQARQLLIDHDLVKRAEVLSEDGWLEVQIDDAAEDHSFVPALLVEHRFRLLRVREQEIDLEDAFMKVTKGVVG
ncbi:MAG: ABC transporter ATP-binding protein [Planctomycetota bacterium]|nr:MAG: ABC transporter ATP-binding protein [Planctomycetota bacterium]